ASSRASRESLRFRPSCTVRRRGSACAATPLFVPLAEPTFPRGGAWIAGASARAAEAAEPAQETPGLRESQEQGERQIQDPEDREDDGRLDDRVHGGEERIEDASQSGRDGGREEHADQDAARDRDVADEAAEMTSQQYPLDPRGEAGGEAQTERTEEPPIHAEGVEPEHEQVPRGGRQRDPGERVFRGRFRVVEREG